MNFTYPFNVEKHEDGDIYLVPDVEKAEYSYEILDKVTFTADSILLGSLQIGKFLLLFGCESDITGRYLCSNNLH